MPTATLNGTTYAYTDEGEGPLIVFGHGLLASKEMFAAQIAALRDRYRCVSIDWPGHGESGFPSGGFTFDDLVADTVALLDQLEVERAIFAGLSQGGMVFMRLALEHPEKVIALILMDTSAGPEDADSLPRYERMAIAMRDGTDEEREAAIDGAQQVLYGEKWRSESPAGLEHEKQLIMGHDRIGVYLAASAVFDRDDITGRIGEIKAPTLVLCGKDDIATPPDRSKEIHKAIEGSDLELIDDSGHHSAIERPGEVTAALERFLAKVPA